VLGVPGFTKRKSVTEVNMREGETIAIAGLVDRSRTKDRQQVPGLGNLPVVGAAFRTTQTRNTETELLVLISPRFVSAEVRPGMLAADPNGDALRRADQILSSRDAPPRNPSPIPPPAEQPRQLPQPAPVPQSAPAPASPRPQPVAAPVQAPQLQPVVLRSPSPQPRPAAVPVYEAQYHDPNRAAPSAAAGSAEIEAEKPKRRSLLSVLNSRQELTPEEEQARQEKLARRAALEQRDLERRIRLLGPTARVYLPATARP
jgi:pilus assembly protein CpaC